MAIDRRIRNLSPEDQIYWRVSSGWPSNVIRVLNCRVGALARRAPHRKIGITNDPARRWRQAYRSHGWLQMHIIYESASHDHVREVECHFVNRMRDELMRSPGYYWNATGGGGGRKPLSGPFYVYLVTAPYYARITE